MNISFKHSLVFLVVLTNQACTTGSSSGSGSSSTPSPQTRALTIRGTIERENTDSQGKRAPYPGYTVCAFGACDLTDAKGEFLFPATAPAGAADVEFSVTGPEFTADVEIPLKASASVVDATLLRPDGTNILNIGLIAFDGEVDSTLTAAGFNDGD